MKPAAIVRLILIVLGVVGFALGGFSFTHKEKVVDLGPIQASADKKESVPIPRSSPASPWWAGWCCWSGGLAGPD